MGAPAPRAVDEWRGHWTLPIAAGLGYSIAVLHIYGIGAFFVPLQQEFGWSRTLLSTGLLISSLSAAVVCIPVGMLIDRFGPRRIGILGVILMAIAFASFGTATGDKTNWILLWVIVAFANFPAQSTVWTSAVASRFEKSRGLALAVALSGASISAAVFPKLADWLITSYGWRTAFPAMAGIWLALVLPFIVFFFRGARDVEREKRVAQLEAAPTLLAGLAVREGLRKPAFYKLLLAAGLFTFTVVAIVVHMVPILIDRGANSGTAAWIAGLVGIFSIIGRLGTGFLLDRLPSHLVGATAFLLPILACVLLLYAGDGVVSQMAAAAIFGLTLGAEVDVISYLISRHFGLKHFGVFFGAIVGALAVGTAFGPLAAGALYDRYGSYEPFLMLTVGVMVVSSLALATLGRPPFIARDQDAVA